MNRTTKYQWRAVGPEGLGLIDQETVEHMIGKRGKRRLHDRFYCTECGEKMELWEVKAGNTLCAWHQYKRDNPEEEFFTEE